MNIENALSALAPYAAPALAAATVALMVSLIIVATRHWHGTLTLDHPGSVQTAHETPTPRIGGMGIYLGMLIAWSVMPAGETKTIAGTIMLAGLPAWLFGMARRILPRRLYHLALYAGLPRVWSWGPRRAALGEDESR